MIEALRGHVVNVAARTEFLPASEENIGRGVWNTAFLTHQREEAMNDKEGIDVLLGCDTCAFRAEQQERYRALVAAKIALEAFQFGR
jgi:hypothetical protein